MTRRRLFGMFAGLIGVPPVASVLEPDFGDPSFDMAAYLQVEWKENLFISYRDLDIAFCNSILKPSLYGLKPLGLLDMRAGRNNEKDNCD